MKILTSAMIAFLFSVTLIVFISRLLYDWFGRRFDWLTNLKNCTGEPRYIEWVDLVSHLENGQGCLLQYQHRHDWALYWHARRLTAQEATEERVEDNDCWFTAQPIGYETTFVLRQRFPNVPIYRIYVNYLGTFG